MLANPKFWPFIGILVAQLAMVFAMPIRSSVIRATGQEISLQLQPVDPFDVLTGYSLDLSYKASSIDAYPPLKQKPRIGETLYARLRKSGAIYEPVSLSRALPTDLRPGETVLKGTYDRRDFREALWFGIEKLYIPAESQQEIDRAIAAFNQRNNRPGAREAREIPASFMRADAIVDQGGNASLMRLHLGETAYE